MSKSVVLLGKGDLAIRIGEWFRTSPTYDLSLVVPVVPEPSWTGSVGNWARDAGIPTIPSGDYRQVVRDQGEDWSVSLAFSVFYDKILPASFIERCGRILNLHNSPLPKYRGVSPINWALKNEEREHGVTIHEITPGIDDGPVVSQVKYSIFPEFDEVIDVYNRGLAYGWTLFEQTIPVLDQIAARAQDESQATSYSSKQNHLLGERRNFRRASS